MGRRMAVAVAMLLVWAPAAHGFDPVLEAQTFAKTQERQAEYQAPATQLLLRQVSAANALAATRIQLTDPERLFATDLCWNGVDGCAGDPRLYDWQAGGHGVVSPVLFTARNGATISGHVWATKAGPAERPGVVITNGSVQAAEQMYWYAAQTLAKAGYVVLTFDPQGQGQSDTPGEGPDAGEGVPAQTDGRPFFDGTRDALDFLFSTPDRPYAPTPSCETGTSHAAKQDRRVREGRNSAFNPFWSLFDRKRVGLAGHSYGASGVSYVGQADPRVSAVVAWDNLADPAGSAAGGSDVPSARPCPGNLASRPAVDLSRLKPALGITADYFLPPTPNVGDPPDDKSTASKAYSARGADTGSIVIRGGSHLDFSYIPNPAFGASLRGPDLTAWYTTAWFDRYVKGDPDADRRLLTDRWRRDARTGEVDVRRDANAFSFYHRSRLDLRRADGTRVTCEDMRTGCAALTADDGVAGEYSYLAVATSPDGAGDATGAGVRGPAATAAPRRCTSRRRVVVHLGRTRGARVRRVVARVGRRVVGRSTTRRVVVRLAGLPRGRYTVRLRVTLRGRGGEVRRVTVRRTYVTCVRKR